MTVVTGDPGHPALFLDRIANITSFESKSITSFKSFSEYHVLQFIFRVSRPSNHFQSTKHHVLQIHDHPRRWRACGKTSTTMPGLTSCKECPINSYTPDNGPHVCVCNATTNHVIDLDLNMCGCIAGYGYDSESGVCSLCPTDFDKTEPGAQACTMCPIGYNTPDDGPHVCVCDATRNHGMDHDLNLCGCIAGYGYNSESGVCSLCPTDFDKTEPGAHNCTMCPIGYNTPDDGPHVCICDATRNGPSSTRSPSAPTTSPMP